MNGGAARKTGMSLEHSARKELRPIDGGFVGRFLDSRPARPRKVRFAQSIAFALALMMVIGACLGVLTLVKKDADKEKVSLAVPMFMTHSPILIESDVALTAANGVTGGDGSAGNPHVIEGWDINASAPTAVGVGIAVSNITSHLIIRNVNVHSGNSSNSSGIELVNVTYATVEYTLLIDNAVGIGAMMCDHVVIQNNTAVNNSVAGIIVFDSNFSLVTHNIAVYNPGMGVALMNSTGSSVVNNSLSFNGNGLTTISCNWTTVSGNIMDSNQVGLSLMLTTWSQVDNNKVVRSTTNGVSMIFCENNTLFSNIIANTTSDGSIWTGYGAWLLICANNTFYHNNFLGNQMSPQAYDFPLSGVDSWNLSYPEGGNYWSDYTGSDSHSGPGQSLPGADGIGDTPYEINLVYSINDNYPLMAELTFGTAPTAYFTVSPAGGTTSTVFTFNASLCWDPDNSTSELQVRWDFDDDGTWDTGWSADKIIEHSYPLPGEYSVRMEVNDGTGQTSDMTWHVEVESVVIPEFATMVVPICSVIAIFLIIATVRRQR